MRLLFTIVLVVVLGAMCTQSALAEGKCMEFDVTLDGLCYTQLSTPVSIGGSWEVMVTGKNTTESTVQLSWGLRPVVAMTDGWHNHLSVFVQTVIADQIFPPLSGEVGGVIAESGKSVGLKFLGPTAGCDGHGQNCDYTKMDSTVTATGTLTVGWLASTPEALRSLLSPVVEMTNSETGMVITVTRRITPKVPPTPPPSDSEEKK